MNIQQDIVWVTFEKDARHWEASIDGRMVQGSTSAITEALTAAGWEIITAIPGIWSSAHAASGQESISGLESMVIFVKRSAP